MRRRQPLFWHRPRNRPGILSRLLWPLAALVSHLGRRRRARVVPQHLPVPVICVGNVNVGGTGKTPSVIALVQLLQSRGVAAHVVSRGYGGTEVGPHRVDPASDTAERVGDEPLLIAAFAPAWISRDRISAARAAAQAGAQAIILDDGLQNPRIRPDLSLLVVDAEVGFGNGWVMPAGPLREPLPDGLARADLVLSIGPQAAQEALIADWPALSALPILRGHLAPVRTGMDWAGQRVLAFAGIGRPGKFFATLRGLGAVIVAEHAFDDHASFAQKALQRMAAQARAAGAMLVTTEKDAARLPPAWRQRVVALPVRLHLQDDSDLTMRLAALGL